MKVIGKTAEVRLRVLHPGSRAEAFDPSPLDDDFPAVLSNPRAGSSIPGIMELAAARLLKPWLAAGETSMGTSLEITYLKSLRGDAEIRAVATCRAVSGRQYHFIVNAFDDSGLVASCKHTRAIVSPRRLEAAARKRHGRPSMSLDV